jgi:hypothetical protein
MNQPAPQKPIAPDGSFDFELTDFAEARDALDNESLVMAAAAARPIDPKEWIARRRPRVATDRALAGTTIDWVLRLPEDVRPRKLCEQFPRLANQIANAWFDRDRCVHSLDDLLVDRRGGRRGLPHDLRREVQALREFLSSARG